MQLITGGQTSSRAQSAFAGVPLSVLFAQADAIGQLAAAGSGEILLQPPYYLGDDDAYLILPEDIGVEIVDILRDGDEELLGEAMRDGLLVCGEVARAGKRGMSLMAAQALSPRRALKEGLAYAATVDLASVDDAVRALNTLPHAQCTTLSALIDDDGLESVLRENSYVGISWRTPSAMRRLSSIDPTYVWSRHLDQNHVGIEFALFVEDDELVALMRPARLVLSR
jgi:hypothetical protein